jgi:hypothetical protein
MGLLQIDDVREGMVLDADVEQNGQTLIKSGVELTERHLRLCRSWGVPSLEIRGADPEKIQQEIIAGMDPVLLQECEQEAREHCVHFDFDVDLHQKFYQLHLHKILVKQ